MNRVDKLESRRVSKEAKDALTRPMPRVAAEPQESAPIPVQFASREGDRVRRRVLHRVAARLVSMAAATCREHELRHHDVLADLEVDRVPPIPVVLQPEPTACGGRGR
eukprot:scaffold65391_cov28-Tisochrysis_lutea.AAC.2